MSSEFCPHAFDLFRQEATDSGRGSGLGIGLSIVAQVVKLHGGAVRCISPGLGQGSTFIVTLPLLLPQVLRAREEGVAD
jgi:signal transduction histidine kinase